MRSEAVIQARIKAIYTSIAVIRAAIDTETNPFERAESYLRLARYNIELGTLKEIAEGK